jgi:hypothetical protein
LLDKANWVKAATVKHKKVDEHKQQSMQPTDLIYHNSRYDDYQKQAPKRNNDDDDDG